MPQALSLHEITDLLETDYSIEASAVVIRPPENATAPVSDKDSGDEGGGSINNLPGSLLRAPAYLTEAHSGQYHFVFDNFFTSIALLDTLSSMGHQATGTLRKGHVDKAQLESDIALKKKERGTFNYRIDGKGNIVCRWNDNSVVTAASSGAGIYPMCLVNHYSQKLKKKIQVQQPKMIKVYSNFMGGIDRANENIDKYRASIHGKKWYSSPLLFCFQLVLQNAWQLHKTCDEKPMDFLECHRLVVCHYLETHGHVREPGQRGRPSQKCNIDSRYDGMDHVIVKQGKQTRCADHFSMRKM